MSALMLALFAFVCPQEAAVRKLPPVPPTRLGVEVLAESPVVVVSRTISVRDTTPGVALLHVRVIERMLGSGVRAEDELVVFAHSGSHRFGDEDLLFLRPRGEAGRFEIVRRVSSTDEQFEAKLAVARRSIWLMEIRDRHQRADAALSLLLSLLQSPDRWRRDHALEELRWMAVHQHAIFTEGRRARLLSAGRASALRDVSAGVENVAALLKQEDARLRASSQREQSPP